MKVLVTGAGGFLGSNLVAHLGERQDVEVLRFTRDDSLAALPGLVAQCDFVFHLAGVNRPQDPSEFETGNTDLTRSVCEAVQASGRKIPVLYSSSIQAERDNPYGNSKRRAEEALLDLATGYDSVVHLFRLPNVFGKWARPNYNSVVATFCSNIAHDLSIEIDDPQARLTLVYVDDVIASFIAVMEGKLAGEPFVSVEPQYRITVGELAEQLGRFRDSRKSLTTEAVGSGLVRALHATYLSYLPADRFAYELPKYEDSRGVFAEMLKTRDSGQFSFFTAHPGITRGGHYHHSKTEKFLVIRGQARFRFRHVVTGQFHELQTSGDAPVVVETVPGWSHDVTNVGDDEMIVLLWASEIFDRENPDTYAREIVE